MVSLLKELGKSNITAKVYPYNQIRNDQDAKLTAIKIFY
jgi:hypothetical protein